MKFDSQSGIAIGPILFIIAVLAVIAAAVAAGSGVFTEGTSTEEAKTAAAAILAQADLIAAGVSRMQIENGCSISQINFTSPNWPSASSNYNNGSAPSDNSCNVFDTTSGGRITFPVLPAGSYDSTLASSFIALSKPIPYALGYWMFPTGVCIYNEEGCLEEPQVLAAVAPFLTQSVCAAINAQLGITGTPPYIPESPMRPYAGNLNSYPWEVVARGTIIDNKTAACFQDSNGAGTIGVTNGYYFFQIISAN